ncbi:MAG: hypothetical protein U5K69_05855 [Balneolaceae bacterium]|nr:hypothetical protein [Balneolaceae bacterium]
MVKPRHIAQSGNGGIPNGIIGIFRPRRAGIIMMPDSVSSVNGLPDGMRAR